MSSNSSARYVLLNQLADEITQRSRHGERPALQEYLERYPAMAGDLADLFAALACVEQLHPAGQTAGLPLPAAHETASLPLERLGDYRILRLIGKGGMGAVYEALQVSLGRRVALKVLPDRVLDNPRSRARFEREARAAGKLHHTNIVPVFGVGEHDGIPYYAMQFIQGPGLDLVLEELREFRLKGTGRQPPAPVREGREQARYIARSLITGEFDDPDWGNVSSATTACSSLHPPSDGSRLPTLPATSAARSGRGRRLTYWQNVAQIGMQVADAVEHAHKQGVLHRDIKPSNLLLDTAGTVWVSDFGLAKADDQEDLTAPGDVLGTLRYLAPETFQGKTDHRSDVYALGLTLFELLTLRPAFDAKDRQQLVPQVMAALVPRIDAINPQVPGDLATIVHVAAERDPCDRYQTAGELAADLQRFLDDEPIRARRLTLPERFSRWVRRNRGIAASLAGAATFLVALTAVSLLAAARFQQEAAEKERLAEQMDHKASAALEARRQAEASGRKLRQTLYRSEMNRAARTAGREGELGRVQDMLRHWVHDGPDLRGWEWYYLRSLGQRNHLTLWGHSQPVTCVAWSPDGTRLVTGGADKVVRLWDSTSGKEVMSLAGHVDQVLSVAWSPDGARFASAGAGIDQSVRIWDVTAGEPFVREFKHVGAVTCVAWSPDATRIASASEDWTVRLWDPQETGTKQTPLRTLWHPTHVGAVAWSPDGKRLATACQDLKVRLWDAGSGREVRPLSGHAARITALAWSPDGARLASGSDDRTVRIWDANSGQQVWCLQEPGEQVLAAAWSPDGTRLVSAGGGQILRVWDPTSGKLICSLPGHVNAVRGVAWCPDGRRIASASADGTVGVWDLSAVRQAVPASGHSGGMAWSPDGTRLVTGRGDGTARVWDVRTGEELLTLRGRTAYLGPLTWGGSRIASADDDKAVRVWDAASGKETSCLRGHAERTNSVAWSPDGARLATASDDRTARVWEAASGKELFLMKEGAAREEYAVAWSPDGGRVAVGGKDPAVRVWDVRTGGRTHRLPGHTAEVTCVTWSPDGKQIASASADRTVRIWEPDTGNQIRLLTGHSGPVRAVAWSPDGTRLASAGTDRVILGWDAESAQEVFAIPGHTAAVSALTWSPDGTRIASMSATGNVLIHDAEPGYAQEASPRLLPLLDGRLKRDPTRPEDWLLRARVRAGQEDRDGAAADFRRWLDSHPEQPAAWFAAGWRASEPFHLGDSAPAHVRAIRPGSEWLPAPTSHDGWADLTRHLPPRSKRSAYLLHPVWSAREQKVTASADTSGPVRFWAGGRLLLESRPGHVGRGRNDVNLTLGAGWNTLLFRMDSGTEEPHLRVRLSGEAERAWEGAWRLLLRGRWREAEEVLGRTAKEHPEASAWLYGNAARCAHARAGWLQACGEAEAALSAFQLARAWFSRVLAVRPHDDETAADLASLLWETRGWAAPAADPVRTAAADLWAERPRMERDGAWAALGACHASRGEWREAREALRKAVHRAPASPHDDLLLALACARLGRYQEAAAACGRGLSRLPGKLPPGSVLDRLAGLALVAAGERPGDKTGGERFLWEANLHAARNDQAEAVGVLTKARALVGDGWVERACLPLLRLRSREAARQGQWPSVLQPVPANPAGLDEAFRCYRRILDVEPDRAEAHCDLGLVLLNQGRFDEARHVLWRGHKRGITCKDWGHRSEAWGLTAERASLMEARVPDVLAGRFRPGGLADWLGCVRACQLQRRHHAAARMYALAFADQPREARRGGRLSRLDAARQAALAASGKGEDAAGLSDGDRLYLRRQCLTWLRAELSMPGRKGALAASLDDPALGAVREPASLASLPAEEGEAWRQFWADVERQVEISPAGLLTRARTRAARRDWPAAASHYAQLLEMQPDTGGRVWFEYAAVLLLAGDEAGHHKARGRMAEQYAKRPNANSIHLARASALTSAGASELVTLVRDGRSGKESWPLGRWGALAHRTGHPRRAVDLLTKGLAADPGEGETVVAWLWLALAEKGTGREGKARRWLGKAQTYLDSTLVPADAAGGRGGPNLHDWLEANVLRRELQASFGSSAGYRPPR